MTWPMHGRLDGLLAAAMTGRTGMVTQPPLRAMATIMAALALAWSPAAAREVFVAKRGSDAGVGDAARPFLTIQRAAQVAQPGDIVTVRAGVYRERVDPAR